MTMLSKDWELFQSKFPEAVSHMNAASLRHEMYTLGRRGTPGFDPEITPYMARRLEELKRAPACNEPWFVDLMKQDCDMEWEAP